MSKEQEYQDILYTAHNVAAGREMVRQYKAGEDKSRERATDAGVKAVAAQVLQEVLREFGDEPTYDRESDSETNFRSVLTSWAAKRGIDLEEKE